MTVLTAAAPRPRRALGAPVLINGEGISGLLAKVGLDSTSYNERWLQKLAFAHPQLLPLGDIEPGFGELVSVAMEIPCGHGYLDNLYITPSGDIVLVEAKLWRNPQARREVVAQALDYVAALTRLSYDAFETACRRGDGMRAERLYELIADHPEALEEPAFVDAVTRNLRRGRMVVIALGDGIRNEAEALSDLLQSHAGAHFTFALVELACWRNEATGDILALPSTLAQTVMILRGVVTFEDDRGAIKPALGASAQAPSSITAELYFEALAGLDPKLPGFVQEFVRSLEPLGVYTEQKKTLILKVDGPDKPINLGYINAKGRLWTDAGGIIPSQAYMTYLRTLANLINGKVGKGAYPCVLDKSGSKPLVSQLLPDHTADWRSAISRLIIESRVLAEGHELPDHVLPFDERYASGQPVMGVVDGEPRSPVIAFVRLPNGFAWCDDGVLDTYGSGHPIHFVEGPLEDWNGMLRCGHTLLKPIDDEDAKTMAYWAGAVDKLGGVDAMHAKFEAAIAAQVRPYLALTGEQDDQS